MDRRPSPTRREKSPIFGPRRAASFFQVGRATRKLPLAAGRKPIFASFFCILEPSDRTLCGAWKTRYFRPHIGSRSSPQRVEHATSPAALLATHPGAQTQSAEGGVRGAANRRLRGRGRRSVGGRSRNPNSREVRGLASPAENRRGRRALRRGFQVANFDPPVATGSAAAEVVEFEQLQADARDGVEVLDDLIVEEGRDFLSSPGCRKVRPNTSE